MIEDWIDEVCKLAGTVWAGAAPSGKGHVRSFFVFKKTEFPEAITEFPTALTYVQGVRLQGGSDSGPTICYWRGVTEFHIAPGVGKHEIPRVMPYYGRILRAFLKKRTLGGLVDEFSLVKSQDGEAVTAGNLPYGADGAEHMGLVVYWKVKESLKDLELGN